MTSAYADGSRPERHHLPDAAVLVIMGAVVVATWGQWSGTAVGTTLCAAAVLVAVVRCPSGAVVCLVLAAAAASLSVRAWHDTQPRRLGPFTGWAEVVGDPSPYGAALRVTLEVEGERFDAWCYGSAKRRLAPRQAGERVVVAGNRTPNRGHARRAQVRHVVGRFDVEYTGDVDRGSPLDIASARVREALRRGAERTMDRDDAALFSGLVIGDDAREPPTLIDAFRAAGLSHLTAVSGQNLAFVLAAASPLLRRLRPFVRWAASSALVGWFMALTRFEPSVLRAGVMALLGLSAFALGRRQSPIRMLGVAVTLLVLADPLLVWSVGFWLSVSATAGVCTVGPWLARRLPGPSWWRAGVGVTIGAQVGVVLPSLLVFHRLPLVSIPANLLAVPVAGLVMLWGIPSGLIAAFAPGVVARQVMWPAAAGTRWVSTVARLGARLEPPAAVGLVGWIAVVAVATWVVWRNREVHDRPPDVPLSTGDERAPDHRRRRLAGVERHF